MKIFLPLLIIAAVFYSACNSGTRGIFNKKTPHEKYAEKLDDRDLDKTPEGRAWLEAAQKALASPYSITLPYRQEGYFHIDKARALGLQFTAKVGEQINFAIQKDSTANFVLYLDVYKGGGNAVTHLLAADTNDSQFSFDVPETGNYTLRIQPELFRTGNYSLALSVGPSLGFPVSGTKANVGSIWGASRDGGKRSHEGIDIFAPKGTPAVAAADGRITSVREGGIGGKTVWLRPEGKAYTLYYAHLDEQLVQEGQAVKKGDVVGTVGNTGNAQTTPAHLHFGIYTYSGAVDPLPFVNKTVKKAPAVPQKTLAGYLKVIKAFSPQEGESLKKDIRLVPLAVTAKGYLAELADGRLVQAPFASVQALKEVPKPAQNMATTPKNNGARRS